MILIARWYKTSFYFVLYPYSNEPINLYNISISGITSVYKKISITNKTIIHSIHGGHLMPLGIIDLSQHWFRCKWLLASLMPSFYLIQCWLIVNWTLRKKPQLNLNQNTNIFIQEKALENVNYKMAAIWFRPQCVNSLAPSNAVIYQMVSTSLI